MVIPWQGAFAFVGLFGLPRLDVLYLWTSKLLSKMQINLPEDPLQMYNNPYGDSMQFGSGGGLNSNPNPALTPAAEHGLAAVASLILALTVLGTIWGIAQCIGPFVYKGSVTDNKDPPQPTMRDGQFHYGLMDCFANCNECMCSWCCPLIRFADTHSSVSGFWGSFCAALGANVIIGIIGSSIAGAVTLNHADAASNPNPVAMDSTYQQVGQVVDMLLRGLVFGLYFRKNLRAKLGDPNPSKAAFTDCLSWAFCSCCALTQESVEADIAANVTVTCPCTLVKPRVKQDRKVNGREVAPNDLLGEALLVEGR